MLRHRVAVAVVACTAIGMTTALAAIGIPGADNLIHGCLNDRNGSARLVPEGASCNPNESAISWPAQAYVDNALAAEAALRAQGDAVQATAISVERDARVAADQAGVAAAQAHADQVVQDEAAQRQAAIDAEAQARAAADANLETKVDSLITSTGIDGLTCNAGKPEVGQVQVTYTRNETTGNSAMVLTCVPSTLFPLDVAVTGTGAGVVRSVPSGIACGPTAGFGDCTQDFAIGLTVRLTATPGTPSTAQHSMIAQGATSNCSVESGAPTSPYGSGALVCQMTEARSATVTFTEAAALTLGGCSTFVFPGSPPPPFTVTCDTNRSPLPVLGKVCSPPLGPPCSPDVRYFAPGTTVAVTAGVHSGNNLWHFEEWTGACAGQGRTCILTLNSNATIGVIVRFGNF